MLGQPGGVGKPGGPARDDKIPGNELLLVEGKSAQQAMNRIRNRQFQGIFRMQGKIPNPALVKPARIHAHEHCAALINLLQAETAMEHYQQVVIVPDPDVDGAHSGYLLISLFRHYLPEWLARGAVYLFKTPLARIDSSANQVGQSAPETRYLYSPEEIRDWLPRKAADESLSHFKGLASMKTDELAALVSYPITANPLCQVINPETPPAATKP